MRTAQQETHKDIFNVLPRGKNLKNLNLEEPLNIFYGSPYFKVSLDNTLHKNNITSIYYT